MNSRILTILVLTVIAACGGAAATGQPAAPPAATSVSAAPDARAAGGCPFAVAGATESVADTEGGVAITFTGPPDQVSDLRSRVRRVAERGMMVACPCRQTMADGGAPMMGMMQGPMANGGGPRGMMDRQGMRVPAADRRVDDVDGGARLTFTAKDPADVAALRAHVRMCVEHLKAGTCPMM